MRLVLVDDSGTEVTVCDEFGDELEMEDWKLSKPMAQQYVAECIDNCMGSFQPDDPTGA